MIRIRDIAGDSGGTEYYAVTFPGREINRVTTDHLGPVVDFGASDVEIVEWCEKTFGPVDAWGEGNLTWRCISNVFYFRHDKDRLACILRWE